MEEIYEVLKFIEHGSQCRKSQDCIRGDTLLRYLGENQVIDKERMFGWFIQLAVCVDQYHRVTNGRSYKYLNPCSIVVTEEKRLFLLDTDSEENAPAMKQMQKQAFRNHFVRPVYEMEMYSENMADLFAYGKTLQFMLACTDVSPELTLWETFCLSRIIGKCVGETGKRYGGFREILKDLPDVPVEKNTGKKKDIKRILILAGAAAVLCAAALLKTGTADRADAGGWENFIKTDMYPEYEKPEMPEPEKDW